MEMTSFSKLYLSLAIASAHKVTSHRLSLWDRYQKGLEPLEKKGALRRPVLPDYAHTNAHIYNVLTPNQRHRDALKAHLKKHDIDAYTHYEPLHLSPHGQNACLSPVSLQQTERVAQRMLRLPIDAYMTVEDVDRVVDVVYDFRL